MREWLLILILMLAATAEANRSPVLPLTCEREGLAALTWHPGVRETRVVALTFIFDAYVAWHQPLGLLLAPDGQTVGFSTLEQYSGVSGVDSWRVDFGPDWLVLPEGPLTFIATIACGDTAPHQAWAIAEVQP